MLYILTLITFTIITRIVFPSWCECPWQQTSELKKKKIQINKWITLILYHTVVIAGFLFTSKTEGWLSVNLQDGIWHCKWDALKRYGKGWFISQPATGKKKKKAGLLLNKIISQNYSSLSVDFCCLWWCCCCVCLESFLTENWICNSPFFLFLNSVEPPCAATSRKRPPRMERTLIQNTKNVSTYCNFQQFSKLV